jgi:predicted AlkP superfamily phosphohydrolase/phosphomutase
MTDRVLAIGLDGWEHSLGETLMAAGELPHLGRLRDRSARFLLDHGPAQRTGLAWEHLSTGRAPDATRRWSAVHFDVETYEAWQEGTSLPPFAARLDAPTVVFDPPYFALDRAPSVRGVVNWGAHDPGVPRDARPRSLLAEIESRFGDYPGRGWIYGIVWPSAARARTMGDALVDATDARAEIATWLLRDRLPDWRFGLVVTGELHSAIEGLWHGVDPEHPLADLPSAGPAGDGLRAVYRATDRLVGTLADAFDDATLVVFAMGGMGPNRSDVPSMVLLPELLYRHAFGRALFRQSEGWTTGALPMLGEDEEWAAAVNARIVPRPTWSDAVRTAAARFLPGAPGPPSRRTIPWMPASRYQPWWHAMRCFALPSFYDGRIRLNLAGRERAGTVAPADHAAVSDEVEALVRACRDAATGAPVVEHVERTGGPDPLRLGPSESDLVVVWRGASLAFDHPTLGRVGPVPWRRPGGHTGRFGLAYVSGDGVAPGDFGVRSSFDVVPTIVGLLGEAVPAGLSGTRLVPRRR